MYIGGRVKIGSRVIIEVVNKQHKEVVPTMIVKGMHEPARGPNRSVPWKEDHRQRSRVTSSNDHTGRPIFDKIAI